MGVETALMMSITACLHLPFQTNLKHSIVQLVFLIIPITFAFNMPPGDN